MPKGIHHPSRRQVLLGLGTAAAATAMPSLLRASEPISIGDSEIWLLSDGSLSLPIDFVYPDAPQEALIALLTETGQPTDFLLPDCNVTLVRRGEKRILFDVGAGPNLMDSAGQLGTSLAEVGVDPSDITDVVFTHAHADHLWGVLDDFDEPLFPNAVHHINRVEWDYWRADDTLGKTPESSRHLVIGAQNRLTVLEDRIQLFGFGDEIVDGIEAVDTSGHTAGHTSFMLHEDRAGIMILGDALTNFAVSFQSPDWPSAFDQDEEQAVRTRLNLLDRLAQDQTPVVGFHLPHPGLGRVERSGSAYRFVS